MSRESDKLNCVVVDPVSARYRPAKSKIAGVIGSESLIFRYPPDAGLKDEVLAATMQGVVVGSDRFKSEIEAMLKRKVEPAKRGRPVKRGDNQSEGEQMSLRADHK